MATITKHRKIGCITKGTKEIKSCEHCPKTFTNSKKITILVFQYPTHQKYNISIGVIIIFSQSHVSFIAYEHVYNTYGCFF